MNNLDGIHGEGILHPIHMMPGKRELFEEEYRVLAVDGQKLTIQGVRSGEVLTIVNQTPAPLKEADYPPGKLIALSDPSNSTAH
jgi:hypothetical protein